MELLGSTKSKIKKDENGVKIVWSIINYFIQKVCF